ncbi:divinyl chlorophyllide a 8-vinyl-reductase, chloroplastic [Tanacetum coccineum]
MSTASPFYTTTLHPSSSSSFKKNLLSSSHHLNKLQLTHSPFSFPLKTHFHTTKRLSLVTAASPISLDTPTKSSFRDKPIKDINVLVVGSTGYIGNFVVKELVNRGFNVIAVCREQSGIRGKNSKDVTLSKLNGANVCFSDVTNLDVLEKSLENLGVEIDVVVSCLASRTGGVKDSWKIDYDATKNSLVAGKKFGAKHFVLLSAICVQKPLLEFPALEAEI